MIELILTIYVAGFLFGLWMFSSHNFHGTLNLMSFLEALAWPVLLVVFVAGSLIITVYEYLKWEYRGVPYTIFFRDGKIKFMSRNRIFDSRLEMKQYIDELFMKNETDFETKRGLK